MSGQPATAADIAVALHEAMCVPFGNVTHRSIPEGEWACYDVPVRLWAQGYRIGPTAGRDPEAVRSCVENGTHSDDLTHEWEVMRGVGRHASDAVGALRAKRGYEDSIGRWRYDRMGETVLLSDAEAIVAALAASPEPAEGLDR